MRCGTLGAGGHVTAKPSVRNRGVLYKSGVCAWKVLCPTPGGLYGVPAQGMADILWQRRETGRQTEKTNLSPKPGGVN